jgi:magnesium transporter
MDLKRKLAIRFLEEHTRDAAAVLESIDTVEAAQVLSGNPAPRAAAVLQWMTPERGAAILQSLESPSAAELVARLPLDVVAAFLRRLDTARRDELTVSLTTDARHALGRLLRFPAGTAGALMDPSVTVLTPDLTAAEALDRIRRSSDSTLFNIYVIDRERALVGVLNLEELLAASPKARVEAIMHPPVHRLKATTQRRMIAAHPGWQRVYSLPVVDAKGIFLGAVRYRTIRQLEAEIEGPQEASTTGSTTRALGDLFAAGFGGIVDAIMSSLVLPDRKPARPGRTPPSRS